MLEKYKGNLVAQLDDLASSPIIYNSNYAIANVLHKNNTYVYNSGINFLDNFTKATFTEKEDGLDAFPNIVNLFITSPPPYTIIFYAKYLQDTNLVMEYVVDKNNWYYVLIDPLGVISCYKDDWYLFITTMNSNYKGYTKRINLNTGGSRNIEGFTKEDDTAVVWKYPTPYLNLKTFLGNVKGDSMYLGGLKVYNTIIPDEALNDLIYRKNIITNQNKIISNSFGESASSTKLVKSDGTLNVKGELIEADGQKVSINKNGNIYATEFIEF